ncbi:MAG TPA: SIP domain-containing protein [Microbacterium sp.]|uniref:SIP domain-containing protein n=1 Tax=Microbacterium sp. TaxID=51671 RepID=UPI002BA7B8BB|nr:SIP domain-containing protein [Microbacterium sp.]HWI31266.1 SIP domain-containing protein [Microbacterium sp.]
MTNNTEHNAAACRASRHTRVQHLITADEHSLVDLEVLLATLPLCSTGRIFVEVGTADEIVDLPAPARMTVTWLDRSRRSGEPGTGRGCAPGVALARAVTAWADEMLCADDDHGTSTPSSLSTGTRVFLLGGYLGTADIVDHLTSSLGVPAEAIHTPERFGLLTAR